MGLLSKGLTNTSRGQQTLRLLEVRLAQHLGHPHEQASPQDTEPFWQQHSEIAYPDARYYPEFDLYTELPVYHKCSTNMDSAPLVIGHNSPYSRPSTTTTTDTLKRPRDTVKVYLEDEYVGEISLGVLTRFSKLAKVTYPRPLLAEEGNAKDNVKVKSEVGPLEGPNGEMSKLKGWSDMAEAHNEEVAAKSVSQAPSDDLDIHTQQKSLAVAVPGAWVQPSLNIVQHILTWMEQNKRRRHNEPLLPLTPAPLNRISLKALVDTYTGVVAYDLLPFPGELRLEILGRLTKQPVQVEQIRYLYEHLPVDDSIINRMITSYFEHDEAKRYSSEQRDAILTYLHEEVDDGGDLELRFDRVKKSRYRKLKDHEAMRKLREGFESFAGPLHEPLPVDEDKDMSEQAKQKQTKQEKGKQFVEEAENVTHRRRKRREQQHAGENQGKVSGPSKKASGDK